MSLLPYIFLLYKWIIPYSVQGNENLIPTPRLDYFPKPPEFAAPESNLIWYNSSDEKSGMYWTNKFDSFLEVYKKPGVLPGDGQNKMACDYDQPPTTGKVCDVDIRSWFPCSHENSYGYHRGSLCVILKLNEVFGWRPDFYNDTNNLPPLMPQDLKTHIETQKNQEPESINTVWVSCEGENPADTENIGPIQYIPRRGFPGYFFPFMNTEGYLSPIVAVFFERPIRGVLISVECKAWAHNLMNDQVEGQTSVHFELLLD